MSTHTADSQFTFNLPSLSYIDAKWEEPNLRTPTAPVARKAGLVAWLYRQISAFNTWRRNSAAANELSLMTDRELMDIGISRADMSRAFDPAQVEDLRQRGYAG